MGPVREYAPDAASALATVERAAFSGAERVGIADLAALAAQVCAAQLGLEPLRPGPAAARSRWPDSVAAEWRSIPDLQHRDAVALRFAEQFTIDVASIDDELRGELFAELGGLAADFAATVFVVDFLPRTRAALGALAGDDGLPRSTPSTDLSEPNVWEALDAFTRAVPALQALDPVVSELVRLRGAGQHHCRLCASLRSRSALLAGAREPTFGAVLAGETGGLSEAARAAIELTDAMIWTPAAIPPQVVGALRASFDTAQRVELVLDVTRNALNKVAVALAADAPHVESGVEIYDVDPEGNLLYGLTLD